MRLASAAIACLSLIFASGHSLAVDKQSTTQAPTNRSVERLFDQHPTVTLNAGNFQKQVYNSPKPWLIVFYASWCGASQQYSEEIWPLMIDYFRDDNVKLGAVEEKEEIYMNYDIKGFPTVLLFPPNSKGIPLKRKVTTSEFSSIKTILRAFHLDSPQHPKTAQKWNEEIDDLLSGSDSDEMEDEMLTDYEKPHKGATSLRVITIETTQSETENLLLYGLKFLFALVFLFASLVLLFARIIACYQRTFAPVDTHGFRQFVDEESTCD